MDPVSQGALGAVAAACSADRETVRNDRRMLGTELESASKLATQFINLMVSALETAKEMNRGVMRNIR